MSKAQGKINEAITRILDKLSSRVAKIAQRTNQNATEINVLADAQNLVDKRFEAQKEVCVALGNSLQEFHTQAFQRSEQIASSLANVKAENDKREEYQTLRDQNNVKSIKDLRDAATRAFNEVAKDIRELISRINNLKPDANGLPLGHEWVNKKLKGVYSQFDEVEARLKQLESPPVAVYVGGALSKVVDSEGHCMDVACNLQQPVRHYFGPGCRFYGSNEYNERVVANQITVWRAANGIDYSQTGEFPFIAKA